MPKHVQQEREPFALGVAQQIIRTALSRDDMWGTRWAAAFTTGARPAELRGLRWRYVDLDLGVIDLAWQLQRLPRAHGCGEPPTCGKVRPSWCPQATWDVSPGFKYEPCHRSLAFTPTKTQAGTRIVPLLAPMITALRQLHAVDTDNPHDLVWHWPDGRPLSHEEVEDNWRALLIAAKVPHDVAYVARTQPPRCCRRPASMNSGA
jgi:integrase